MLEQNHASDNLKKELLATKNTFLQDIGYFWLVCFLNIQVDSLIKKRSGFAAENKSSGLSTSTFIGI